MQRRSRAIVKCAARTGQGARPAVLVGDLFDPPLDILTGIERRIAQHQIVDEVVAEKEETFAEARQFRFLRVEAQSLPVQQFRRPSPRFPPRAASGRE